MVYQRSHDPGLYTISTPGLFLPNHQRTAPAPRLQHLLRQISINPISAPSDAISQFYLTTGPSYVKPRLHPVQNPYTPPSSAIRPSPAPPGRPPFPAVS